jgi:hypothetical protein
MEAVVAYCKVLSRYLRKGTEENYKRHPSEQPVSGRDWKQVQSPTDSVLDLRERKQQEFGKVYIPWSFIIYTFRKVLLVK